VVTRGGLLSRFDHTTLHASCYPVVALFLRLISELIKLALALATIPWSFWIAIATLVISLFTAAMTGGILLYRRYRERHLDLEFRMMKNPARVNEALDQIPIEEASLRREKLELIYFRIRNDTMIILPDNRIWIEFSRGFKVLDEDAVNELQAGTPLGTLQEEVPCVPLLYPDKRPTFKNLIWGKGNVPNLLMLHLAYYDPSWNTTTILSKGDKYIPVWVRTPGTVGEYKVTITIRPRDIDRALSRPLTLHVR
jgi:hypothetical protein